MDMITNGELNYNQSTQRKFVYANIDAYLSDGKTTKSGALINSMLIKGIQLPAVYFWKNTETGKLNIHDGKQRLLSIYYFINPTKDINVTALIRGRDTNFEFLPDELKDKLLNYTFDIVYREGTSLEEEESFDLINSNAVPLTKYECFSGMFYGTFLREFESYIEAMAKNYDALQKIGRGEQAYKLLLECFNLSGETSADLRLKEALRPIRQNPFDAKLYGFDQIVIVFNQLMKTVKGIKEDRAITVAGYIVRSNIEQDKILDYYRECMRLINDISSWDLGTHKTFVNKFIYDGIRLDPQRTFSKEVKDELYGKSPRCAHVDEFGNRCKESSYSKLQIDHIVPWANGGRTTLDNAQLLCKDHNTSKGNRE